VGQAQSRSSATSNIFGPARVFFYFKFFWTGPVDLLQFHSNTKPRRSKSRGACNPAQLTHGTGTITKQRARNFFGPARVLILQFLLKREAGQAQNSMPSAPALRDFCVGQAQ
jgi:hypothetical protein